jgi:uncharacterized protein (DUF342 family)
MTKLSNLLGEKYQAKRANIFIRSFELGGHTFKVRIPFVAESDAIYKKISDPDQEHIERIYKQLSEPLLSLKDNAQEDAEIEFKENDIVVKGRSMREAAKNKAITENRVVEYIKLLVPEQPDMTLNDLTYEEVEAEFPWTVQVALIEKISEAISPNYKETRGN